MNENLNDLSRPVRSAKVPKVWRLATSLFCVALLVACGGVESLTQDSTLEKIQATSDCEWLLDTYFSEAIETDKLENASGDWDELNFGIHQTRYLAAEKRLEELRCPLLSTNNSPQAPSSTSTSIYGNPELLDCTKRRAPITFDRCKLSGVDFTGVVFYEYDPTTGRASTASIGNSDLSKADFSRANLKKASFYIVNLRGTKFTNADLSYADLTRVDLAGANLSGANLTGTFVNGDMTGANLTGANLTGADLSSATLAGANLTGAIWMDTKCPGAISRSNSSCGKK
jgi:uncharacterized protein YjbI with pentapeptide repeats